MMSSVTGGWSLVLIKLFKINCCLQLKVYLLQTVTDSLPWVTDSLSHRTNSIACGLILDHISMDHITRCSVHKQDLIPYCMLNKDNSLKLLNTRVIYYVVQDLY